jgi:hypothetical protein
MVFMTSTVLIISGVSFISGSIIGIVIGNQVTRRNIRNESVQEFEEWICSFENDDSELNIKYTIE